MLSTAVCASKQQKAFIEQCYAAGHRLDNRTLNQLRDITIEFPLPCLGTAVCQLGKTSCMAAVSCELVDPSPTAPKHGFLDFSVARLGAAPRGVHTYATAGIAATGASSGTTESTVAAAAVAQIQTFLESLLRGTKALDTESLCVLPGRKVWSMTIDVTILADDGNALDCCCWAALAGLLHFKRPEITITEDNITVHPPHERDPVPVTLHHLPVPVSFGVINAITPVMDPTTAEAYTVGQTYVTVAVNTNQEVCIAEKVGGEDVTFGVISQCVGLARAMVPKVLGIIRDEIAKDVDRRKAAKLAEFKWVKARTGVGKE